MSCKGTININTSKNYNKCSLLCDYEFKFNTTKSSCSITNKKKYLDIRCFDGANDISISGVGRLSISSVRLYYKSLNQWNNKLFDAELIIQHRGNGKNLWVCIPVTKASHDNVSGSSIDWFKSLYLKGVPTHNNGKVSPSPSGEFNLSMVMPDGGFYYLGQNGLQSVFGGTCNKSSNSMLIFRNPVEIRPSDLSMLSKKITQHDVSAPNARMEDVLYNSKGVTGSQSSEDEYETICTPIVDEDGTTIDKDGNKAEWAGWIRKKWQEGMPSGMWWLGIWLKYHTYIIIVLTLIVLGILQYFKIPNKFVGFVIGLFDRKQPVGEGR